MCNMFYIQSLYVNTLTRLTSEALCRPLVTSSSSRGHFLFTSDSERPRSLQTTSRLSTLLSWSQERDTWGTHEKDRREPHDWNQGERDTWETETVRKKDSWTVRQTLRPHTRRVGLRLEHCQAEVEVKDLQEVNDETGHQTSCRETTPEHIVLTDRHFLSHVTRSPSSCWSEHWWVVVIYNVSWSEARKHNHHQWILEKLTYSLFLQEPMNPLSQTLRALNRNIIKDR